MSMIKNEIMNDDLDHNKWSRQIRTYGMEITKKISKLKILIIGMRGYGVEIAKNIILSNPRQVSIFDNNISKINDLTSNFLITEEDVKNKKRRDEACLKGLCELNPSTKVIIENNYQNKIKEFDIVIMTEIHSSEIINLINSICHENRIGFIYTLCLGLFGIVFLDFGETHFIIDKYAKKKKKILY
jgi:ubiquitin-activating enzyme E1